MTKNHALDLCLYIAASAAGLRDEPKDYGTVRLVEVLSRLAGNAADEHDDSFLRDIAAEAAAKLRLGMTDRGAFYAFLEQLVIRLVREAKRRRRTDMPSG